MFKGISGFSSLLRKKLPSKLKWITDPLLIFGVMVAVFLMIYAKMKSIQDEESRVVWPPKEKCITPYIKKGDEQANDVSCKIDK